MSLKDWIKKVDSAQLNEFVSPPGTVPMKTKDATGKETVTMVDTKSLDNTLKTGLENAAKNNKLTGITPQQGQQTTGTQTTSQVPGQGNQAGLKEDDMDESMSEIISMIKRTDKHSSHKSGEISEAEKMANLRNKSSHDEKHLNESTLAYIESNHPHEKKNFLEGWGMHESLYEALKDYYFKEGYIPRDVMSEGGQALRDFIEECYAKDTMGGNEDAINNGMLDENDAEDERQRIQAYADEFNQQSRDKRYAREIASKHLDPHSVDRYERELAGFDLPSSGEKQSMVGKIAQGAKNAASKVAGLGKQVMDIATGDSDLKETSKLERMLSPKKEGNDMYESKKSKKAVGEAIEKTKTGIKHKADAGGYGRVDDEDEGEDDKKSKKAKAKKDEPKKGKGRPKKADTADGEGTKFDLSALNKAIGGKAPKSDKWDKKKTTKITKMKDGDKNDKEELDESIAMWDRQLKTLLSEGLTISTSVGNEGGTDSVNINASNEDAHQLLKMLQNAGMGTGMPAHAIQAEPAPATVLPKASPATTGSVATTDGAPNASAQKDINGGGNSVPIMAMPRGMAFSVNSDSEMPTEPGEFGTLDQEEVVSALGSEQGSADDNGESALAAIKKLLGHGASEVSAQQATPAKEQEVEVELDEEEKRKKPDEDGDGVPDWADKKPGEDDNAEEDEEDAGSEEDGTSDKKKDDVEESLDLADATANDIARGKNESKEQTCNECGGLMEEGHECGSQLNEWANSPQELSEDEQFEADINFMTKAISGGLNGLKETGQTTVPVIASQTNRQSTKVSEGYNIDVAAEMRKLAGIR